MITSSTRQSTFGSLSFRHVLLLVILSVEMMFVSGCVSTNFVEVKHKNEGRFPFPFLNNHPDEALQISADTREVILEENLDSGFGFKRNRQIYHLERSYKNSPSRKRAQALAELHFANGQKSELISKKLAQESYLKSIIYSHHYFFDSKLNKDEDHDEDKIYHVRNLYNKSLENYLRIVCKNKVPFVNRHFQIQNGNKSFSVSINPDEWTWKPSELDHFEFVSDYKVNGIEHIHKTTGLGVPLIAVRKSNSATPEIEKHFARGVSFPITAFMHLEADSSENPSETHCRLVLYDPHQKRVVTVNNKDVTLETDLTTPLAYFMHNSQMKGVDHLGLLRPDKAQNIAGIYMLRPYQEDKIPVLMIHGLWSSPQTWLEAYNDLHALEEIQDKYQFWFYLYPSGKPFIETAADLREDLDDIRRKFDPNKENSNLDHMVLVGHSMGGLIAKAVTVDSGDRYWNAISNVSLDSLKTSEKNKDQIKRVLFFDSNPSVNRVITVATPHRGSRFSNGPTRWLIRRLVTLPKDTLELSKNVLTQNPNAFKNGKSLTNTTSVDSLSPDSSILKTLRRTQFPEGVKHHNIVGVLGISGSSSIKSKSSEDEENTLGTETDGVVSYGSSHVEDAESELVVEASHSQVQKHKDTIAEIYRILIEHKQDLEYKNGILPVNGTLSESNPEPDDLIIPSSRLSKSREKSDTLRQALKPSLQTKL